MKPALDASHSKRRKIVTNLIVLAVAIFVALLIGEVLLRVIPIPGVQFNTADYSPIVGTALTPNVVNTYRNERGDYVERRINRFGYMDKDHTEEKPAGIYRIGFFGDSYTEARQVPLEDTFFRLIEADLGSDKVECFSFGIIGFSILQSYLTCMRWSDVFDLDLVVYVFCENDVGDEIKEMKRSANIPYAVLTPAGFEIDRSFRKRNDYRNKPYYRIANYLTSHSLVIATIWERIRLLAEYGIKMRVTESDRMMAARTADEVRAGGYPRETDPPSTWPDSLRAHAEDVGRAIILKWRDEVESKGRRFAVMHIPRGELASGKVFPDSWVPWLEKLCADEGIAFIDTTPQLLDRVLEGKEVFYDHFTKDGHIAAAEAFTAWYRAGMPNQPASTLPPRPGAFGK
jgi:hypothetical protein